MDVLWVLLSLAGCARIGYLTCNLFLHRDHELMLLLINTMQRDLGSANHIEVGSSQLSGYVCIACSSVFLSSFWLFSLQASC